MTIANKGENGEYHLSFIEYEDQGQLHYPNTRTDILESYRGIAKTSDVMLITFVHGCNHNANGNPEDGNIVSFRKLLEIAAIEDPTKKVIGIYIAWRGRSLPGFLTYLTFWDRKATAHEVGQQGITEALLELEGVVNRSGNPNNRMVTIGHSFGGAALFSSIHSVMSERYISSRPFKTEKKAEGFGDLVLLINPAFEALQYGSLYDLSQDECRPYPKNQLTKLVILSSEADSAVSKTFPIGRFPSTLLETHRKTKTVYCNESGQSKYDLDQWSGDVLAVGHYITFRT